MEGPQNIFVQRPWPKRELGDSPLRGRRVLVVSREVERARAIAAELSRGGASAQTTVGGDALVAILGRSSWEVVVGDTATMEPADYAAVRGVEPRPSLLLLGELEAAECGEEWVRDGIFAVLAKPVRPEQVLVSVGRALEARALEDENRRLRDSLGERYALGKVMTRDPAMRAALKIVESVADTRATVLLSGESGTGKSMLAHTIHRMSSRSKGPFIVVNCGSLPETLLESELFGHVRGAFTGAVKDKPGRFEQADGGTIFLDEIDSASLDLQVKLLRVLQDRTFERVGDERTRVVDVRIITASNADLGAEIAAGRFREDLYYRIYVVSIHLPRLRDRPRDIALLAEHFRERFAAEYAKPVERLDPDCLSALVGFPWPGNVRQLENAIERSVLMSNGTVLRREDLGEELRHSAEDRAPRGTLNLGLENLSSLPPLKEALEGPERQIIHRALELNGGNRQATARMLQVNRTTLFNKMRKYGLMDLTFEAR
ncbi:MAG: sigma-54-dependent Fis family transcriptional regulator [Planctomycetota bacterium]|nr:MAG: sigma-54-dependent Fis family transcriptional regulator [Planctomycetota bacterium]